MSLFLVAPDRSFCEGRSQRFSHSRWLSSSRCTAPALADIRILSSGGGSVGEYLNFFAKVRQSGERVVIDGPCLSACTLVLSAVPRKRICVTPRAILGFHAPYLVDAKGRRHRSREITKTVHAAYPPASGHGSSGRAGSPRKPSCSGAANLARSIRAADRRFGGG